jgi:Ca2+/Na+ antiporter
MSAGQIGGLAGAIVGILIGLAGGVVGTYFSIKNTKGPRERAFMIRAAVVCWLAILVFLGLIIALPDPYRWLMWIPYAILLPAGIIYGNRKQQSIRREESPNEPVDGTR